MVSLKRLDILHKFRILSSPLGPLEPMPDKLLFEPDRLAYKLPQYRGPLKRLPKALRASVTNHAPSTAW